MVGKRIRELRKERGLRQIALGRRLNTTQQTISKIENGISEIPLDMLTKASQYFNVTTDYLLGLTDIRNNLVLSKSENEIIDDQLLDLISRYKRLSRINQETVKIILARLEAAQYEEDNIEG